jgi:hypothetical protein
MGIVHAILIAIMVLGGVVGFTGAGVVFAYTLAGDDNTPDGEEARRNYSKVLMATVIGWILCFGTMTLLAKTSL